MKPRKNVRTKTAEESNSSTQDDRGSIRCSAQKRKSSIRPHSYAFSVFAMLFIISPALLVSGCTDKKREIAKQQAISLITKRHERASAEFGLGQPPPNITVSDVTLIASSSPGYAFAMNVLEEGALRGSVPECIGVYLGDERRVSYSFLSCNRSVLQADDDTLEELGKNLIQGAKSQWTD